jgi:alpha-glucosidase
MPSALLDYTNPAAASYWHSLSRQETVELGGKMFFMTGGEPEVYSPSAWYRGVSDPTSHSHYAWANRFSLKWMESIRTSIKSQVAFFSRSSDYFILSRSGLGGMGRFGAGIFTVDPNLGFPLVSAQARAHLNLSGIDYYTTDATPLMTFVPLQAAEVLYEAWFARIAFLNLPLMVPDSFVPLPWARQALYQKAKLEPFYYSLSHQSALSGDPVSAPLLYWFQDDQEARTRSYETMLGPNVLVASGVDPGSETVDFYLPQGRWYSLFDEELITAGEGVYTNLPAKLEGMHLAPILLKEGAIVPTWDKPEDPNGLPAILIFPGPEETSYLWYEEAAGTVAPGPGRQIDPVTITTIELKPLPAAEGLLELHVRSNVAHPPKGHNTRAYIFEFVGIGNVRTATLDGELYDRLTTLSALQAQESGWTSTGNGRLVFKTPPISLEGEHVLVIK